MSVAPNTYGHPIRSALDLYAKVGATVFRIDRQATVMVQASGAHHITTE